MDFFATVILLVIIMDPLGLPPVIESLLCPFDTKRRVGILFRELVFSLIILLVFLLCGNQLMVFLNLDSSTLNISGGVLLFMVAIGMIFPMLNVLKSPSKEEEEAEPFIVPIAVPLVAGPSCIAVVLLHSAKATVMADMWWLALAVVTAWAITAVTLLLSQYVMRFLGNRGAMALEKLMGMLLILISVQMFLDGLASYNVH